MREGKEIDGRYHKTTPLRGSSCYQRQIWRADPMEEDNVSDFRDGQEVEVTCKDERHKHVWHTAKILKVTKNNKILVEHENLLANMNEPYPLRECVDSVLVRPLPPSLPQNQSFQVGQIVDAFYKGGWCKGEIDEALDNNNRYRVYFPVWEKKRKFEVDKLRVHQEWVGGKWVKPNNREGHLRKQDSASKSHKRKWKTNPCSQITYHGKPMSSRSRTQTTNATEDHFQQKIEIISSPSRRFCVRSPLHLSKPRSFGNFSLSDGAQGDSFRTRNLFLQKCSEFQSPPQNEKSFGSDKGRVVNQATTISGAGRSTEMMLEHWPEVPQYKTLCGKVVDVVQTECLPKETQQQLSSNIDDTITLPMQPAGFFSPANIENRVLLDNHAASLPRMKSLIISGEASINNHENVTASAWSVSSIECTTNGNQSLKSTGDEANETGMQVFADNFDEMTLEECKLPFIKSYPVWDTFKTMEVFRLIPQSPHFGPLADLNELLREGEAVGYMLSFSSLVEQTCKAQLDEPICIIVQNLQALEEFQALGFNTQSIQARLEKLLTVKTGLVCFDMELRHAEAEIVKEQLEEESLKSVVQETDNKIIELQELKANMKQQHEMLKMKIATKNSNVIAMEKTIQEIKNQRQENILCFNQAAACPW